VSDRLRAFLAVQLPEAARACTGQAIEILRGVTPGGVRWTAPESQHLTLKFLGEIPEDRVDALVERANAKLAGLAPVELALGGFGAFPSAREARVLWLGVSRGAGALAKLARQLDSAARVVGAERERRPFSAHLTLGRLREPARVEIERLASRPRRRSARSPGPPRTRRGAGPVRRIRPRELGEEKMSRGQPGSKDDKQKAVDLMVASIEKQFGKGSIMVMGQEHLDREIAVISTGSPSLDIALGIGGLPKGRVVEIYGPESSGKTTLSLHAVAECQRKGGVAAFIDAEHALDVSYAKKLGVSVEELLVSQPDTGEQALEIADMLVRSGAVDVVVIDSVAALVPKAEIEGEMGDQHVGLQARLMSQALRKLTGNLARSNACLVFINQVRMKIGVMFGNPETTSGGNALKFYASVRLDVRRIGQIKDGEQAIGSRTRVKVVKNKCAPPFRQAEFDLMFDRGISREGDILDLGSELGLLEKSGTWYSFEGTRIGQGRENAKAFLIANPDVYDRLAELVYANAGIKKKVPVADGAVSSAEESDET